MNQLHTSFELERISRITKYLPRDDLERFALTLVENFLEIEHNYCQLIESLKSQQKDESQSIKNVKI